MSLNLQKVVMRSETDFICEAAENFKIRRIEEKQKIFEAPERFMNRK